MTASFRWRGQTRSKKEMPLQRKKKLPKHHQGEKSGEGDVQQHISARSLFFGNASGQMCVVLTFLMVKKRALLQRKKLPKNGSGNTIADSESFQLFVNRFWCVCSLRFFSSQVDTCVWCACSSATQHCPLGFLFWKRSDVILVILWFFLWPGWAKSSPCWPSPKSIVMYWYDSSVFFPSALSNTCLFSSG